MFNKKKKKKVLRESIYLDRNDTVCVDCRNYDPVKSVTLLFLKTLVLLSDLSKNRFTEIPREICEYRSIERIRCYNNIIRIIPEALVQLQALAHLNLR